MLGLRLEPAWGLLGVCLGPAWGGPTRRAKPRHLSPPQAAGVAAVRLLVEKVQVDINARSRTEEETYEDPDLRGFDCHEPGLDTALHLCAKGFNWWQVRYCLPYLLHHGAGPYIKNEAGATPYEITQADYKQTFMDDAAKLLEFTSRKS